MKLIAAFVAASLSSTAVAFASIKVNLAPHAPAVLRLTEEDTEDGPWSHNRRDALQTLSCGALSALSVFAPASLPSYAATDYSYLGPLAALIGTWKGSGGLSVTGVPSRRSEPTDEGAFELLVRPYKEILTIEPIIGTVKNRGGSIDQFSGVVTYKQEVWATDDNPGLMHVEDGMFFYLDDIEVYSDGTPGGKPAGKAPFAVARSATVPHGNSAMLFGSYKTINGAPIIPDIDARPIPNEGSGYDDAYTLSQYNAVNPNKVLQDAIINRKITKTTHISLDSRNDGSVTNTPFIRSRADTTGFRSDFWVETVKDADGSTKQQLQYSEFVDILFHRAKNGSLIDWPHVMVNTLVKEA